MNKFFSILLYLWQLPQNLAGLILRWVIKGERKIQVNSITVFLLDSFPGGISLGTTIIVSSKWPLISMHEHGHQIQSLYLGPLYLLVIGLPSLIWAGLYGTKLFPSDKHDYYNFYTESWANKLGGIQ